MNSNSRRQDYATALFREWQEKPVCYIGKRDGFRYYAIKGEIRRVPEYMMVRR